ncbi:ATP-binding cassette sub-family C member 4-like isoform X5 [Biomphalaria glabrata]|uniref:ATP-binding cassette sub-family C member 4-like isoform X5 n=1 Tax=Biomphalaria glabrata TaxID=6526 RepID=A0A9W2YZ76_BIOGL|nr:ATP-binding cassette sub-family C member 4-like isoform X5 [Biomphalaria glabrata]
MDESLRHINPNPTLSANIFSRTLFCWLDPLFKKGYKRPLEDTDLYNVCPSDSSEYLGNKLEDEWNKQLKKGGKPSLLKALMRTFGLQYMLVGLVVFFEEATKVVQPLLLGGLIRYFTPDSPVSKKEAWLYAMGVSLCAIVLAITHHPYFFCVQRIGMRMRIACCSLMYKKCLRLSNKALGETTIGQIVNLMSNDVNRFDQAVVFLHFLWVGPVQAIAVLIILWHELGPSVLAGFFVLLLLIPVQGFMGKLFSKLRHKTAIHTDERVKVMNEIISGMRVIKMYCWEKPFGELVEKIRKLEHVQLLRQGACHCNVFIFWDTGRRLLMFPVVLTLVLQSVSLRASFLYLLLPMMFYVNVAIVVRGLLTINAFMDMLVTSRRIQRFLLLEELGQSSSVDRTLLNQVDDKCYVELDNVTAKWDGNTSESNTLENISLRVDPGKLVAVIGPVGAGKSSLLMSILGELPAQTGSVKVSGKVSYVSQQPWIFSGSVRQNIVFGGVFDKAKYDRIIKVCALTRDLEIMPNGDTTLIGDRGVSLSGGQRARVSLARALYMDADIYLLDDPLSAVDAAVGRHIFEKCIVGYLKKKPRILVTHQVQFLPVADTIYILKEGKINIKGSFDELSQSGVDFSELLKRPENEEPSSPPVGSSVDPLSVHPELSEFGSHLSLASIAEGYEPEPVQLPEVEERAKGNVGMKIYVDYFKAGSGVFKFTILVLLNIAAQLFYIGSDWWLSRWSNQEEVKYAAIEKHRQFLEINNLTDSFNVSDFSGNFSSNITIPYVDSHFNIYVFTGIILAVFLFGLARALLFFKIAVDASQTLHNMMFARILRSPISFFDSNPVGRILNRFSKDVGHMDDLLPVTFFDFIQCALLILGIVLVAGIVNPYVFIPTVPLAICFVLVRKYYLQTSRSIKRLEGTTRSPVFSYLSATLQGLHTIRSMNMEQKFMEEFDAYQDKHSEAWFLFLATSRWLAVRLDWLCALFVTAVTVCSVLAADTMSAGLVGLSITYTMTLMGMFQWGVRQSAEVENQMISVERVLEYSRLPEEAALESKPDTKPPPGWPYEGQIVADKVCLRYSPSGPLVLKDLTFVIHGREKVGIVGRTGAGKSSLITTLFRMSEPEGKLEIDGINIQQIGLHDLRSTISIIPQDPVLFTGSLRKNLDPFQHHSDEQLWKSLDEVKLREQIKDIPEGLGAEVSEGGVNFSVGQRQLICLARAILRNNRILLIDEATANVDPITDELIQQTIRTKFRECTVLTIAHRLHTIIDSDRVMVLDNGFIVEFEKPYKLMSQGHGFFYEMVQQLGKAEFDHLLELAREADKKNETKHITANGVPAKLFKSQNSTLDSPTNLDTSYDISDLTYEITDIENSLKMIDDVSDAPEVGARAKKADAVSTNSSSVTPLTATSASDTEQTALLTPTSPEEEASLAETKAMLKTEPHDRTSDDENDEGDESLVLIKSARGSHTDVTEA